MGTFSNFSREKPNKLAFSVLEQAGAGKAIEMGELTSSVMELLHLYHNQVCEPDASWITGNEIEALTKILHLLADGIEKVENINK